MASDIKSYEFESFDSSPVLNNDDDVESYTFKEFSNEQVYDIQEVHKDIKIEREFAQKNDFSLSPIVREYRGHSDQERIEKERRIADEVQKRVDKIKEDAYREGFESGVEQGREEVFKQTRAETQEKMASLVELIDEVLSHKDMIMTHQKQDIAKMIKVLTKWVILRELESDDSYIERLLEKLILEMQTKSNLLVQVSHKHFDKMPEVLDHVQKKLGDLKNVRVEIDYDIEDQGINLESDNGIIRGTVDQQLKGLDKLFENVGVHEE